MVQLSITHNTKYAYSGWLNFTGGSEIKMTDCNRIW